MNSPNVATEPAGGEGEDSGGPGDPRSDRTLFVGVLAVLLATGWAANHFAALLSAISVDRHLSEATLELMFGIYAAGLLPGLIIGGRASDVWGRAAVAWAGSAGSLAATVAMLLSQDAAALLSGRLILGFGVGLAISSCTAWASDLRGPAGAAVAGAVLTAGFAVGPFVSGMIASTAEGGIRASFGIAAALVVASTGVAALAARRADVTPQGSVQDAAQRERAGQGAVRALSWALPIAPWVFASATLAFVTIPGRMHTGLAAPLVAGTAALITNGVSGLVQLVARARQWGPQAGTFGALLAAIGYAITATAPRVLPAGVGLALLVLLGCAAGLCLREGLIDLEVAAPQHIRGALTGAFYAVTYVGFGLPLLLTTAGADSAAILAVLSVLATAAALARAVRLRRDGHRQ